MDVVDAIRKRKSIRGFTPDPVPAHIIREILGMAARAPSATNGQPWEVAVVTGEPLDKIRQGNVENLISGVAPHPEVRPNPPQGNYRDRKVVLAEQLYGLMGIDRKNHAGRNGWVERGYRFYDSPVALIIYADNYLDEAAAMFDLGLMTQNICLAALEYGLGTCIEGQGVAYPEVVRQFVGIPKSKRIAISIAIGYPDPSFPANLLQSLREPIEEFTAWFGFTKVSAAAEHDA